MVDISSTPDEEEEMRAKQMPRSSTNGHLRRLPRQLRRVRWLLAEPEGKIHKVGPNFAPTSRI